MIEVKSYGTQSICAQRHIIAEVAASRSKLWLTFASGNRAPEMQHADLIANAAKIPEPI